MRHLVITLLALVLLALPAIAATNVETIQDMGDDQYIDPVPGDVWGGPRDLLFDGGPIWNCQGCGVGGADESILWTIVCEMNTLGAGNQLPLGYWIADDFEVPAGEVWNIEGFTFFGYQTNSPTDPSTFTEYHVMIYDDVPPAGNVVFGDDVTNLMISSVWANVYRVTETTTGSATNRPIMASECMPGATFQLGPGTYWMAWQAAGTGTSGPWAPPIAASDWDCALGAGYQSLDYGLTWAPVLDTGVYALPIGFPFLIHGTIDGGVPVEESSWGKIKTTF
jgi:hypothetical protein